MMQRANTEGLVKMVQQFSALGREADALLDVDSPRLAALLSQRDALLAQLSSAIAANPSLSDDPQSVASVVEAMRDACSATSTLIARVADRTDVLRAELRNLGRGARATSAYQAQTAAEGRVHVRR